MSDGYHYPLADLHAIDATQSQQGHWTERKLEEGVVQVAATVLVRPYEGQRREGSGDDGVERDFCNYGTGDSLPGSQTDCGDLCRTRN